MSTEAITYDFRCKNQALITKNVLQKDFDNYKIRDLHFIEIIKDKYKIYFDTDSSYFAVFNLDTEEAYYLKEYSEIDEIMDKLTTYKISIKDALDYLSKKLLEYIAEYNNKIDY